jgi:hypothetical protein
MEVLLCREVDFPIEFGIRESIRTKGFRNQPGVNPIAWDRRFSTASVCNEPDRLTTTQQCLFYPGLEIPYASSPH